MARVKLSEFKSKSLLVDKYSGFSLRIATLDNDIEALTSDEKYVIKVDQGVKKRSKQGLIRLNVSKQDAEQTVKALAEQDFECFIAEPMFEHDDGEEKYVSFERVRGGIRVLFSQRGGVDIEDNPESVQEYDSKSVPLPAEFVDHILRVMNGESMSLVEINPLIVRDGECTLLDAAVLVDSTAEYTSSWSEADIVEIGSSTEAEKEIRELNANSPAAFSFKVLNPSGTVWLLLSGGGASITIADEAANLGKADLIGNYGEYSGGPTTEEAYLYTKSVLKQVFASPAPKKAIIIAGGVANFTDVKKTFTGLITALGEHRDELAKAGAKIFVRRGGPNEVEGLELMKIFLENNDLYGSVHGSDVVLTDVVAEALEYVDA